jgi:hypothetical protein
MGTDALELIEFEAVDHFAGDDIRHWRTAHARQRPRRGGSEPTRGFRVTVPPM